jgi:hypothetical protein
MIANATTTEIETVEELTIYSLDHSHEGIESLINGARKCGKDLRDDTKIALETLLPLTNALHDFDSFEYNLCSLFEIDRKEICDKDGSLETAMGSFRACLVIVEQYLEKKDISSLALLLLTRLPSTLARIQSLLPSLRHYIDEKYIQPETKHA